VQAAPGTLRPVLPDGVHRLELPTPFAIGPVSAYLLRGDPLTLVDPGPRMRQTREALERGLRDLGLRLEDIELIVLTHQHHDHVGLAAEVRERSGARVAGTPALATLLGDYEAAMDRDDAYAVAMMQRHGIDADTRSTLGQVSRSFRHYSAGVEVDAVVRHGDVLVAGGRELEVLERPGHSPTDTVFFDASDGLLVGGDHLLERISSNPLAHPPPDGGDPVAAATGPDRPRPLVTYLESLAQTAEMAVSVVAPGHGEAFGDHRALIEKRRAMHGRRGRRILRAVDGARTAGDMIEILWRALPVRQHYLAMSEIVGHLDLLAVLGRVVERERDGLVVWERRGAGGPAIGRARAAA
jgi:glyoxylase-like metal-dependent hydrolase (beta-lactamase superfamily II)